MKRYEWHLMRDLPITVKIVGVFLLLITASLVTFSWLGYKTLRSSVQENAIAALHALSDTKKRHIEDHFELIGKQIITLAGQERTIDAAHALKDAFFSIGDSDLVTPEKVEMYRQGVQKYYEDEFLPRLRAHVIHEPQLESYLPTDPITLYLQYYYIVRNPNPTGDKYHLDDMAEDASKYRTVHTKYQQHFRDFFKRFSQYDIFLVDPETGFIIYTVFKEVDFATNLLTGPYRDTNFARVFKKALEVTDKEKPVLIDFEFYDPSYAAPAAFIALSIFDGQERIAVLIFQIPGDAINNITVKQWQESGLGKTGQSYIVANDYTMRSNARLLLENPDQYFARLAQIGTKQQTIDEIKLKNTTMLLQEVNNQAVKGFLRGDSGETTDVNFLHVPVMSVFAPLEIADVKWGLIVDQDIDEVFAPATQFRTLSIAVIVISLLVIGLLGFLLIMFLFSPLQKLLTFFKQATAGSNINIHPNIQVHKQDEIGLLMDYLNQMLEKIDNVITRENNIKSLMQRALNTTTDYANKMQANNDQIIKSTRDITGNMQSAVQQLQEVVSTQKELRHLVLSSATYRQRLLLALEAAAKSDVKNQQIWLDFSSLNVLLESFATLTNENEKNIIASENEISSVMPQLKIVNEITTANVQDSKELLKMVTQIEQLLQELKAQLSLFNTHSEQEKV